MVYTAHSGPFIQDVGGPAGTFGEHGNFEFVVSNGTHQGQDDPRGMTHYWRDNVGDGQWWKGARFGYEFVEEIGGLSLIQYFDPYSEPIPGTFMGGGLLVIARGSQTGALGAWQFNPGYIDQWTFVAIRDGGGRSIVDTAGSPALIQSEYRGTYNLELVVPNRSGGLTHYWGNWTYERGTLHKTVDFAQGLGQVAGVSLIQSNYADPNTGNKNLEVVAVAPQGPNGRDQLYHCWREGTGNWSEPFPIEVISHDWGGNFYITEVQGSPTLIQGTYQSDEGPGNFELIVGNTNQEITHYWRDNTDPNMPWRYGSYLGDFGSYQYGTQSLIQSNYGDPGHLEVLRHNVPPFDAGPPYESWGFWWFDGNWQGPFGITPNGGF